MPAQLKPANEVQYEIIAFDASRCSAWVNAVSASQCFKAEFAAMPKVSLGSTVCTARSSHASNWVSSGTVLGRLYDSFAVGTPIAIAYWMPERRSPTSSINAY